MKSERTAAVLLSSSCYWWEGKKHYRLSILSLFLITDNSPSLALHHKYLHARTHIQYIHTYIGVRSEWGWGYISCWVCQKPGKVVCPFSQPPPPLCLKSTCSFQSALKPYFWMFLEMNRHIPVPVIWGSTEFSQMYVQTSHYKGYKDNIFVHWYLCLSSWVFFMVSFLGKYWKTLSATYRQVSQPSEQAAGYVQGMGVWAGRRGWKVITHSAHLQSHMPMRQPPPCGVNNMPQAHTEALNPASLISAFTKPFKIKRLNMISSKHVYFNTTQNRQRTKDTFQRHNSWMFAANQCDLQVEKCAALPWQVPLIVFTTKSVPFLSF